LDFTYETIAGERIVGKKTLLPFQKGFLMSITAVKRSFASLQALYNPQTTGQKEKSVVAALLKALATKFPAVHEAVIRSFIKTRTFICIHLLNRQKLSKRFVMKKMKKVTQ